MMSLLANHQRSSTASPSGVADRIVATSYQDKTGDLPALSAKSQSIPISGVHRTASELQLCEDEAYADYRDYVVYSRIVRGISRQQQTNHSLYLRQENDRCLGHIMSTRNNQEPLQSMSTAPGMTQPDSYYCGEEPPPQCLPCRVPDDSLKEEDGIFTLEL